MCIKGQNSLSRAHEMKSQLLYIKLQTKCHKGTLIDRNFSEVQLFEDLHKLWIDRDK
jgi:hypothetical protein